MVSSGGLEAGTAVVIRGEGVGVTRPGLWGRYAVVPDAAVHRLPSSLEPAAAVALLTPVLTAHTAVRRVAEVVEGETVVVTGITESGRSAVCRGGAVGRGGEGDRAGVDR